MPAQHIVGPLTFYLADVGSAFPDVSDTPTTPWTKLGTSGAQDYEDGISVTLGQTIQTFTPAALTAPTDAFRTAEQPTFDVILADTTAAEFAKVMNDATVTQTGAGVGTAGVSSFELYQGLTVATFAMVARGVSAHDPDMAAQYQVPIVYQSGSPKPSYTKTAVTSLAVTFALLYDSTDKYGKLVIQTADPS